MTKHIRRHLMANKLNYTIALLITSLNFSVSAADVAGAQTTNAEVIRLIEFQRSAKFTPDQKLIDAEKAKVQNELNTLSAKSGLDLSFHVVSSISDFMPNIETSSTRRLAFLDLDETFLFRRNLGFILGMLAFAWEEVQCEASKLLDDAGLGDIKDFGEFYERYNRHFKIEELFNFNYTFTTVVDAITKDKLSIPQTLRDLGFNVNGMTARKSTSCDGIQKLFQLNNFSLMSLSDLAELENLKSAHLRNGIIYMIQGGYAQTKFGQHGIGFATIKAYLDALAEKPKELEIFIFDNSRIECENIAGDFSYRAIKAIENQYGIKLKINFIMPIEESWFGVNLQRNWDAFENLWHEKPAKIALSIFEAFLKEFPLSERVSQSADPTL